MTESLPDLDADLEDGRGSGLCLFLGVLAEREGLGVDGAVGECLWTVVESEVAGAGKLEALADAPDSL